MSTSATGRGASAIVHKSIEALIAAHPNDDSPKAIIRRLAREKIAYAKTHGWSGPPYCPKEFVSIFGIKCKEVDHDIDGEGRILLSRAKKLEIEYRKDRLPERQRFTIFHEFAHTLFPDYCAFIPQHQSSPKNPPSPVKKFERLCDVGASEMLMPFDDFTADIQKQRFLNVESVHAFRERYHASIDATIYRLLDLMTSVGFAAAFLTDQRGINQGFGPLWVKHSSRNSLFKTYIPAGVTPPRDSVATQCYRNNLETTAAVKETWWIKGAPRSWLVQAAKLPTVEEDAHYPKVVALLFPTSYGKKKQTG
jgi:Zn-dependent peptidase ImmA (M78 family)